MTGHPEDAVIADIDALIDTQLAAGPHDDYTADYYPRCECGREWHGLPLGRCPGSPESGTVEVLPPEVPWGFISAENPVHIHTQAVRLSRGHVADLVIPDEAYEYVPQRHVLGARAVRPPDAYTLADVEAMRARVRFWQDHNGHRWLLEGVPEIQRYEVIDRPHPMVRLRARLHDVMQAFQNLGVAFEQTTAPLTEMIEGLIAMEAETPAGFESLGYIHPENFEFVEDREYVIERWGRGSEQVRHEVTVEFDPMTVGPGMERLIQ